jgi:hypothetical protein
VTFTDDGRLVSGGFDGVRISDWQRGVTLLTIPGAILHVDAAGRAPKVVFYGPDNIVRVDECDVCGSVEDVLRAADERTTRELTEAETADFHVER